VCGVVKHDVICAMNLLLHSYSLRVSINKSVGEAFRLISTVVNNMNVVCESALVNVSRSLRNDICQNQQNTKLFSVR
jgi:hypothetical protein